MFDAGPLTLALILAGAAAVIAVAGRRLAQVADTVADLAGLGEALTGALLLGATTSLPGTVTTIVAAADGRAEFAVSHVIGGIAIQTAFLSIADIAYKRANLEHAAASAANVQQGILLVTVLGIAFLGFAKPDTAVAGVHVVTPMVFVGYGAGLVLIRRAHRRPQWRPKRTAETREDVPVRTRARAGEIRQLIVSFIVLGAITGAAGFVAARAGAGLIDTTPLSASVVGGIFVAFTTSLPELITALGAVRIGALSLAVGDVLGGNSYDVVALAMADLAFRDGSIYAAVGGDSMFLTALGLVMTGVVLLGLVERQPHGIANIGTESALVLALYVGGMVWLGVG